MKTGRLGSFAELDFLNPIIVKELRQGSRSKAFVINFIFAHIAMLVFVLTAFANATTGSMMEVMVLNTTFWTILGFFLLVGVPLSGINAINQERAEARLDLLHLTRLSALQVVRGKWLALFSQSLLITVSILPYVLVRYYYGSVNVVNDLVVIAILLAFSAFSSALSVSLSSLKYVLVRIIVVLGAIWLMGAMVEEFSSSIFRAGWNLDKWYTLGVIGGEALIVLAIALEYGASTICAPAENHQSRIRMLYLLQLVLFAVLALFADEDYAAIAAAFSVVLGIAVLVNALVQQPIALSTVYSPFVRFGRAGKLLGRLLLYPGYPSAVYLTFITVITHLGLFYYLDQHNDLILHYFILLFPTILGCFFVPLAFALCLPNTRTLFARFFVLAFILLLIGILSAVISDRYGMVCSYFFVLFPVSNLFTLMNSDFVHMNALIYVIGSFFSLVVSLFYIYKRGLEWRRVEGEMESVAEAKLERLKQEKATTSADG